MAEVVRLDRAGPRILVVEDDPDLRQMVVEALRERGYMVVAATTGDEALEEAVSSAFDLILLDLMLPGVDGYTVCREIRARTEVPIVVLSGRRHERDRIRALNLGADAYLTKPVGVDELLAAVSAALRRPHLASSQPEARLRVGGLELDLAGRRAYVEGRAVRLTPTEFRLLEELARQAGRVVPTRELLQRVWGPQYGEESDYVYVYMHRLRQKLQLDPGAPVSLDTEPGIGYALRVPD